MNLTIPFLVSVGTNQGGAPITNGQDKVEKTITAMYMDFNTSMDKDSFSQGLSITPTTSYYLDWQSPSNVVVHFWNILLPSTNYSVSLASSLKSLNGWTLTNQAPFLFTTDGYYSTLPFYAGANLDDGNNTALSTNQINSPTLGSTNIVSVIVHYIGSTNMDIVSLYKNSKIKYLYGSGDPLMTGSIQSIQIYSGNDFLYILDNLGVSNYYDLSLTGGQGGIEDVLQNPLSGSVDLFLYSTN